MNRSDKFEKYKITKVSTDKVCTNVYMDSFGIEKVRFQNASYADGKSIDCYLDFDTIALLAEDASTGRLINKIEKSDKPITITMGGTKSSKTYDGAPESRIMSIGKRGDTIFVNMVSGLGTISNKGLIVPTSQIDKKISVAMSVDDFRKMLIFTRDCVNAYLTNLITNLVFEAEQDRANNFR